jgi:phosphohistidine phosphatase
MTLELLVMRHAEAVPEGSIDDDIRPLTTKGKAVQVRVAKNMTVRGHFPKCIFTSPLIRAQQTGKIIAEMLGTTIEIEPALGFPFDQDQILKRLQDKCETVLLIGHAPTLSSLVKALSGQEIIFSKSSYVRLFFEADIDFGKAKFLNYFSPDFP